MNTLYIFEKNVFAYPSKRKIKKLNIRKIKKQNLQTRYINFDVVLNIKKETLNVDVLVKNFLNAIKENKLALLLNLKWFKDHYPSDNKKFNDLLFNEHLKDLENINKDNNCKEIELLNLSSEECKKLKLLVYDWLYDLFLNFIGLDYQFAFASTDTAINNNEENIEFNFGNFLILYNLTKEELIKSKNNDLFLLTKQKHYFENFIKKFQKLIEDIFGKNVITFNLHSKVSIGSDWNEEYYTDLDKMDNKNKIKLRKTCSILLLDKNY